MPRSIAPPASGSSEAPITDSLDECNGYEGDSSDSSPAVNCAAVSPNTLSERAYNEQNRLLAWVRDKALRYICWFYLEACLRACITDRRSASTRLGVRKRTQQNMEPSRVYEAIRMELDDPQRQQVQRSYNAMRAPPK